MRSDFARSFEADASDRMSARLRSLAGFAPESAERVSGMPHGLLLVLLPLLVCHPPSARRLELGLHDVFDELLANSARARVERDRRRGAPRARRVPAPGMDMDVPAGPIYGIADIARGPQSLARSMFESVALPDGGGLKIPAVVPKAERDVHAHVPAT